MKLDELRKIIRRRYRERGSKMPQSFKDMSIGKLREHISMSNFDYRCKLEKAAPTKKCKNLISLIFEMNNIYYPYSLKNNSRGNNFIKTRYPITKNKITSILKLATKYGFDFDTLNKEGFDCIMFIVRESNGVNISKIRAEVISFLERFVDVYYDNLRYWLTLNGIYKKLTAFRKSVKGKNTSCIKCGRLLRRVGSVERHPTDTHPKRHTVFIPSHCFRSESRKCSEAHLKSS